MHTSIKNELTGCLANFESQPLEQAALGFWKALGYASQRRVVLSGNTPDAFEEAFRSPRDVPEGPRPF